MGSYPVANGRFAQARSFRVFEAEQGEKINPSTHLPENNESTPSAVGLVPHTAVWMPPLRPGGYWKLLPKPYRSPIQRGSQWIGGCAQLEPQPGGYRGYS